ncbi:MAG TPA: GNAT family N-acetyltransferase [Candidatus Cloacimonadota bacterium]|nr:GNAT family N-acetyltransferase [Candidatus Cloacimonadota bacterium]HQB41485.1 GNAT family N-acetyltransferase [Candidatus Cloacimonadota bacterium]
MTSLQVVEVKTKKELKEFIKLPFKLYKDDPYWVAPLIGDQLAFFNSAKNPYYKHSQVQLFLIRKSGETVGRISAHTNKMHNQFHQDKKGFFGFFDLINDQEVAHLLLETATDWLQKQACDSIAGPYNFSTNDECGLLVQGFERSPFVMMTHNHSYYEKLLVNEGFTKVKDLYAWLLESNEMPEFLRKIGEGILAKEPSFSVRSLDKKNLKKEVETVFTIYQKAWAQNWGFVPMMREEFDALVQSLLPIVVPELVFIAEVNGEPAGFSVALPDYNEILKRMHGKVLPFGLFKALYYKNKIHSLRVITMGVVNEYQNRGIDGLFYYYTWKIGLQLGFNIGEFSWVLEDNDKMNKIAKHLGASIHKTYRLYDRVI